MLLLLRRMKHDVFMNREFNRYLGYAIGELLLVIVGILIALQIDNWNEDRKEQATLQSYLQSVARNMQEDLAELEGLREDRLQTLEASGSYEYLRDRDSFTVPQIFMLNRILVLTTNEKFFSANTSGFEALKVSGVLDRLQGTGLESLISSYYDNVRQIELLERSHYELIRPHGLEITHMRRTDVESFAVSNPSALSPERFEALQPMYRELIRSPIMESLTWSLGRISSMMLHYDSLAVLARAFESAIEGGIPDGDVEVPNTPIEDWKARRGPAVLVEDGRGALESYWLVGASNPGSSAFRFDSIRRMGNEIHVQHYGGAEWASAYFSGDGGEIGRPHMDFSRFNHLVLELKGSLGGEEVQIIMKDVDYPDDIAPVDVPLVLSDDWQTYEIDLAVFAPNDLSRLTVPLGFNFFPAQEPATFSVHNVHFR